MDKNNIEINTRNRKAMEFLETVEELESFIKELYDEIYLSGVCLTESSIYANNYFHQEIGVLANVIYGPFEEMLGTKGGMSTYVEKHPGIFGRRGEEAKDLLMGAYEMKKELLLKLPPRLYGKMEEYAKRLYPIDSETVLAEKKEIEESLYLMVKDEMNCGEESGRKMLDRKHLKMAYDKTRLELGASENSDGKCLPELENVPKGVVTNEIWKKQKQFFSVVKQMAWNLILASMEDGSFRGQERK